MAVAICNLGGNGGPSPITDDGAIGMATATKAVHLLDAVED